MAFAIPVASYLAQAAAGAQAAITGTAGSGVLASAGTTAASTTTAGVGALASAGGTGVAGAGGLSGTSLATSALSSAGLPSAAIEQTALAGIKEAIGSAGLKAIGKSAAIGLAADTARKALRKPSLQQPDPKLNRRDSTAAAEAEGRERLRTRSGRASAQLSTPLGRTGSANLGIRTLQGGGVPVRGTTLLG